MGFDQITKYLLQEVAVIRQAPVSFTLASLVVLGLGYGALNWAYSSIVTQKDAKIATLEERIRLRDDQLANRLSSIPPEEARTLIQKLETRLNELSPRQLSDENLKKLSQVLEQSEIKSETLIVFNELQCQDCRKLAVRIALAINSARGWKTFCCGVDSGHEDSHPKSGIAILVSDIAHPPPVASVISRSLEMVGFHPELQQRLAGKSDTVAVFVAPGKSN
jgi:hypothetical protein